MLYSLLKESYTTNPNYEYEPGVDIDDITEFAISSVYECQVIAAELDDNYIVAEYCSLLSVNEGVGDVISSIFHGIITFIKKVIEAVGNFFKKIFSFLGDLFSGSGSSSSSSTSVSTSSGSAKKSITVDPKKVKVRIESDSGTSTLDVSVLRKYNADKTELLEARATIKCRHAIIDDSKLDSFYGITKKLYNTAVDNRKVLTSGEAHDVLLMSEKKLKQFIEDNQSLYNQYKSGKGKYKYYKQSLGIDINNANAIQDIIRNQYGLTNCTLADIVPSKLKNAIKVLKKIQDEITDIYKKDLEYLTKLEAKADRETKMGNPIMKLVANAYRSYVSVYKYDVNDLHYVSNTITSELVQCVKNTISVANSINKKLRVVDSE